MLLLVPFSNLSNHFGIEASRASRANAMSIDVNSCIELRDRFIRSDKHVAHSLCRFWERSGQVMSSDLFACEGGALKSVCGRQRQRDFLALVVGFKNESPLRLTHRLLLGAGPKYSRKLIIGAFGKGLGF